MPRKEPLTLRVGRLIGLVLLAGLAVYAAAVLLGVPCRGVADNLDFFRVTQPAGIEPLEPPPRRPGRFVQCEYADGRADLTELFSSAALFAWAAKHLPFPSAPGTMAIQQMGFLWLALWLLLVLALVRAGAPLPALLAVFVVVIDPGYLLFWNSFYADAALLFALAGSVALLSLASSDAASHLSSGRWNAWATVLVMLGFVGSWSKMQYILFAAVLAVAVVPALAAPPRAWRRLGIVVLLLLMLTLAAARHFFLGSGPRFPWANNYHAVYAGIAQVVAEPNVVLRDLDVPERFHDLPRRDVFSGRIAPEHPVHAELADLSRFRLLAIYATDPQALIGVVSRVQAEMARVRTHTRGNYTRSAEHPRKSTYDPIWRFGRLRSLLLGHRPWLLWPYLAMVTAACAVAAFRGWNAVRRAGPFLLLLLWFLSQVVVVVLGDGFVAFEQHLIGARLALDLLIALTLLELSRSAIRFVRRRRGAAGRWRRGQAAVGSLTAAP